MLIILTSLVSMNKIQKNFCSKVRLVRMISIKTKEYFLATIYEYGLWNPESIRFTSETKTRGNQWYYYKVQEKRKIGKHWTCVKLPNTRNPSKSRENQKLDNKQFAYDGPTNFAKDNPSNPHRGNHFKRTKNVHDITRSCVEASLDISTCTKIKIPGKYDKLLCNKCLPPANSKAPSTWTNWF